jgi:glucosamine--fructose-6-phosphate aminotransferase (isomerizing)
LKIKEITYIHAEAFSAGEMKHGPIALIESSHPKESKVMLMIFNDSYLNDM